ncbi:pyruvate kinase [Pontibacter lucknowensis]|uniref:pyruvate kinase n=1 Tax=Pontibacter lucknowensis TaxID=1077936 RepID=A0A1N7A3P3_9BACT|nr:pyruvate kinase [Pontibacter lucknowensis]SIR33745.1 pyruvate kinase [Pontibacter lucknowensis]
MMQTDEKHLQEMITQLDQLHHDALELEKKFAIAIKSVHPSFRKSARNLLHYLSLRQHDIRHLQEGLSRMGLSSLGRAEGHVLASLQAVRDMLCQLRSCEVIKKPVPVSFDESGELLEKHTNDLLGPSPKKHGTRIMVTFSTDLAHDHELLKRMLLAGMDCARINCAHDNEQVWEAMVQSVRKAEKETGRNCKILMDLMGPKLRTGPLKPGPALLPIRPIQNELGQLVSPAKVWLAPPGEVSEVPVDASLPLDEAWVAQLQQGDKLRFRDTRGRKRTLTVMQRKEKGVIAHLFKTSYIGTGTELTIKKESALERSAKVGQLPASEAPIYLRKDDLLVLTKEQTPGEPALYDAEGHIVKPAHIACTLPEVFSRVKAGQPILFDDGKIAGTIMEVNEDNLLVKITEAKESGSRLLYDKGINLPETKLNLEGLTQQDRKNLAFVAKHADAVSLSFVNQPEMVEALHRELKELRAPQLGIMLKIETKEGFRNLPRLLLTVMKNHPAGVMIARGDLAVECGWERLAEVQEEILWLSEAAHIPVVWATQVLESLSKKGRPSRAEITDAAMSQRADCVMLNKGPYVLRAIELLDDILKRMQEHQHKKTSMLRLLHVSELEMPTSDTAN